MRKEESESYLDTYENLLALIPGFKYNLVLCSEVRYQRQSTKISCFYCLNAISRHPCRADEPHPSFYLRSLDNLPASTRVITANPVAVAISTEVNTG